MVGRYVRCTWAVREAVIVAGPATQEADDEDDEEDDDDENGAPAAGTTLSTLAASARSGKSSALKLRERCEKETTQQ